MLNKDLFEFFFVRRHCTELPKLSEHRLQNQSGGFGINGLIRLPFEIIHSLDAHYFHEE
jgi:hypothetical protein